MLTATHPDKTKAEVRLFNNSNQEVRFKLEVQFEFERLELDRSPLRKSIEQMRSPKGSHRDGKRYSRRVAFLFCFFLCVPARSSGVHPLVFLSVREQKLYV